MRIVYFGRPTIGVVKINIQWSNLNANMLHTSTFGTLKNTAFNSSRVFKSILAYVSFKTKIDSRKAILYSFGWISIISPPQNGMKYSVCIAANTADLFHWIVALPPAVSSSTYFLFDMCGYYDFVYWLVNLAFLPIYFDALVSFVGWFPVTAQEKPQKTEVDNCAGFIDAFDPLVVQSTDFIFSYPKKLCTRQISRTQNSP